MSIFDYDEFEQDPPDHVATMSEAVREWAWNCGGDPQYIQHAWMLHDYDAWVCNPHYRGPPQPHPESE